MSGQIVECPFDPLYELRSRIIAASVGEPLLEPLALMLKAQGFKVECKSLEVRFRGGPCIVKGRLQMVVRW